MARLARPWALVAPGRQRRGPLEGPVEHRLGRHHLVDEPHRQRLVGAHLTAGEDQVLGPARADQAREALGAAAAGDDAEQDLRLAEASLLAGDAEVAGQRQLAAAAQGEARDRRDGGARDVGHRVQRTEEELPDELGLGPGDHLVGRLAWSGTRRSRRRPRRCGRRR